MRRWQNRSKPFSLMIGLFALILLYPFFDNTTHGKTILALFYTWIVGAAIVSSIHKRGIKHILIGLGVTWLLLLWIGRLSGQTANLWQVTLGCQAVFGLLVVLLELHTVFCSREMGSDVLCRAISGYLLLGLTWAVFYMVVIRIDPNALHPASAAIQGSSSGFRWGDILYYSFVTLTTLGYGDITPISPVARSLTILESILGPLYIAILLTRAVALLSHGTPEDPPKGIS